MQIRLYEHPLAVVEPKVFEVKSVAEWLLNHYGEAPNVALQIYKGEPSNETDVSSDAVELIYGKEDYYTVLQNPGTGIPAVDAFLIQVAIAVIISVTMSVLFPPPDMPGNVNRTQSSPNNSLASRENQVRLSQRVEDIYGTVKAIPSLMMPTYNKYINHKQMEYGYYCIGRGYYDITELKDGDTLLSNISKSGAKVYAPFTSPNSGTAQLSIGEPVTEGILTVSRPEQVNGITLKALNQVQLSSSASYTFDGDRITQARNADDEVIDKPNFQSVCSPGDEIIITGTTTTAEVGEWHDAVHDIVDEADADHWHVITPATSDYNGTYTIESVEDGYITVVASFTTVTQTASIQIADVSEYTDWVTLDDKDRTQVWCNVVAKNGMFSDNGEGKVDLRRYFALEVEKLNIAMEPTGIVETVNSSLNGSSSDERAITLEHTTSWIGPCRVRMRRTDSYDYEFKGTIVDEMKWQDLYSVTPVGNIHFGNKTTIQTVSQATPRATSLKQRQLNCIASRKLPIYDGSTFSGAFDSTGLHASGTIAATSKLVNILHAITIDPVIGASVSQLDLPQVWGVQQELDAWSLEAGQFNYTFDSDTTSFEETIVTVANAGFCLAYRQNGKIRLAFDKLQTSSTALFTHRNKKPNSESISRTFTTESEYDGVEFVFRDPETDQTETIKLPLDESATKYKKFEIPGIRSFTQAWYRANREYQRLRGQRLSIETDCTTDARLLLPNTRVDIVDNTRFKAYDGEVVKQDGLILTLSREVAFGEGVHSILLMKRDGSLQSIICTAGVNSNQVVLQSLPDEAIVTTGGYDGIRTIFSFASDDARLSQAWLVQEIGLSDNQYIKIKAINYSDKYYYYDTQPVPAKASIINLGP